MIPFHTTVRAAILVCTVPLAAQQTWHVNCNGGPGVDFTDLPPAVAAAAPGDTILVYEQQPWCQNGYTAPTITKPLRIEGFEVDPGPPPPTTLPTTPSHVGVVGIIQVSGIPAGQRVVLSNLSTAHWLTTWPPPPAGISITDCNGSVLLENLWFSSNGMTGSVLSIVRCVDVVLRDNEYGLGDVPIHIEDSNVLLTTCLVDHEPPFPAGITPWSTLAYTQNSPALDVIGSDVTIVGSFLSGYGSLPGPFQPAVWLDNSTLRVGPASILRGTYVGIPGQPAYTVAYRTSNPAMCQVFADPRSTIDSVSSGYPPLPIPTAIDATYHSRVVAGYPYAVTVAGPEDGFAMMLLGDLAPTPTPTIFGNVALDPTTVQIVDLVHLTPSGGYYAWYPSCPTSAPVAHPFVFQALTLSTTGQFGVTVRSPLTVGWQHGVTP